MFKVAFGVVVPIPTLPLALTYNAVTAEATSTSNTPPVVPETWRRAVGVVVPIPKFQLPLMRIFSEFPAVKTKSEELNPYVALIAALP